MTATHLSKLLSLGNCRCKVLAETYNFTWQHVYAYLLCVSTVRTYNYVITGLHMFICTVYTYVQLFHAIIVLLPVCVRCCTHIRLPKSDFCTVYYTALHFCWVYCMYLNYMSLACLHTEYYIRGAAVPDYCTCVCGCHHDSYSTPA